MISANINLAAVCLLLCSAGIVNARMLHQAATPTPTPSPTPSIDASAFTPTPIPSIDGHGNNKPDMPPGSDRDEHGCIPSAGESWCESTQECIQESNTPCPAESDDLYACPSPNANNLAGGWAEAADAQTNSSVNAAASFVLQSLGQENEAYTVDFACTQVVLGTNFYMVVSLGNGGKFTATVYQQLPASNGGDGSYRITSLKYED